MSSSSSLLFRRCVLLLGRQRHVPVVTRHYGSTMALLNRALSTTTRSSPMTSLPPNLEVDARSTCLPMFSSSFRRNMKQEETTREHDITTERKKEDNDDDDTVDKNNDAVGIHDNDNNMLHVIPLPDRLHVQVLDKTDATQVVGTLYLNERIFGHDAIRIDLLQRTVEYQRNQKRGQRTAKTKTIGEVRGSTRKVRPQKGGGTARAGHSRPAHWRGGAKAHGPKGQIQDYSNCKLNKHVRTLALTHALSQKLREQNLVVINDLSLESHKTKPFQALLRQLDISGRHGASCFILDHVPENDNDDETQQVGHLPVNLTVASQNLYNVKVSNQWRANVYDILKHEKLILTVNAIMALEERLEGRLRY